MSLPSQYGVLQVLREATGNVCECENGTEDGQRDAEVCNKRMLEESPGWGGDLSQACVVTQPYPWLRWRHCPREMQCATNTVSCFVDTGRY